MPAREHVRKDPGVTRQLLVRYAREHRDGKLDRRESVKDVLVLMQRNTAVVQVAPLMHAGRIDAAIDADHQIERQTKLRAELTQRPEDEVRQRPLMRLVRIDAG